MPNQERIYGTIIEILSTEKNITWSSSNTNIASVDSTGLVTAVSPGECDIIVTSLNNIERRCRVRVEGSQVLVNRLNIQYPNNETKLVGDTLVLLCSIRPSNGSYSNLNWTVDQPTIAQIISSDRQTCDIKFLAVGSVEVTASIPNSPLIVSRTFHVVDAIEPLTSIRLYQTTSTTNFTEDIDMTEDIPYYQHCVLGEEVRKSFSCEFTPQTTTDKDIIWSSSDPNIATLNPYIDVDSGKRVCELIFFQPGDISLKAKNKSGSVEVVRNLIVGDVVPIKEFNTTYNLTGVEAVVGESKIGFTYMTSGVNASLIQWDSSDSTIATITPNSQDNRYCTVNFLAVGSVTITASIADQTYQTFNFPGKSSSVVFNVNETLEPTSIDNTNEVYQHNDKIYTNEVRKIYAAILPENASNNSITWTSSNNAIASIVPNINDYKNISYCNVIFTSAGSVTITAATANGLTKDFAFTVQNSMPPVDNIYIDYPITDNIIPIGEKRTLIAKINPNIINNVDTPNESVIWASSNPTIASIESFFYEGNKIGIVTFNAIGDVTITITSRDGLKTDNIIFHVVENYQGTVIPIESITFMTESTDTDKPTNLTTALTLDESNLNKRIYTMVTPSNATNQRFNWRVIVPKDERKVIDLLNENSNGIIENSHTCLIRPIVASKDNTIGGTNTLEVRTHDNSIIKTIDITTKSGS